MWSSLSMFWDLTNVQFLEDVARYFKMLYNVDMYILMLLWKIVSLIAVTCSRILEPFFFLTCPNKGRERGRDIRASDLYFMRRGL